MSVVQFAPFSSLIQPPFWHELTRLKLEVLRLSENHIPVTASYSIGKTIKDRNTGQEIELGCNISVGGDGLDENHRYSREPLSVFDCI
jgi:ubiquitin-like modifier-activating enzyme ATG7